MWSQAKVFFLLSQDFWVFSLCPYVSEHTPCVLLVHVEEQGAPNIRPIPFTPLQYASFLYR